jgi:hypothetical protein
MLKAGPGNPLQSASMIEKLHNDWIPFIYREKVRSHRTRSFEMDVPERENVAEILHTLLGIELKVGKKRFSCPDLATARYLRVFARIGCRSVAIPYDITKISVIADELEVAWHKLLLIHDESIGQKSPQAKGRSRSALIRQIRDEINELGAGDAMPEFKNSTRQRNS